MFGVSAMPPRPWAIITNAFSGTFSTITSVTSDELSTSQPLVEIARRVGRDEHVRETMSKVVLKAGKVRDMSLGKRLGVIHQEPQS